MTVGSLVRVSPRARIGRNSKIGDFTIVHDNVVLGDDVEIESHCVIGYPTPRAEGRPLVIGDGALIRSHSVFYEGSTFEAGLHTGHRVTVREQVRAGLDLQIGTLSDLQGYASIGDYVRTHSNVHIGHLTSIGNYVWIFPYVVFTNDPHPPSDVSHVGVTVEDFAVVATMVCVMPGVRIGTRSVVGAHSLVTKDVEPDTVVGGAPARPLCAASEVKLRGTQVPAYPWMRHFHRGYPESIVAEWKLKYGEPEEVPE